MNRRTAMRCRHLATGAVVLLALSIISPSARAGFVTFAFEGEITSVRDDNGLLGAAVEVGTPFSGVYTFDSATPDTDPNPRGGVYENAITDFSGLVGGIPFEGPGDSVNTIEIRDDWGDPPRDQYVVFIETTLVGHELETLLGLYDITGLPLVGTNLSSVPPDPALFEYSVFRVFDSSEQLGISLRGDVTSLALVPEPATVIMLGLGTWLVSRRRRAHPGGVN